MVGSASVRTAAWPAPGWLLVAVPLAALIAQLWPTLHQLWTSSTAYSHGYIVLALAAWLAVREARRGPIASARPSFAGLAALVVVAMAALAANVTDVRLVQEWAVPALLVAAGWAVGGFAAAKRVAIPAGYLCFAISIWDYLTEPLQALTTAAVGAAARLTAIPVHITGNTIHIPSGTFEVEGGCSGLHYAVVATALAAYWGLLQYRGVAPRLMLCIVAFAVALLANWVRVYAIVLAGHLTDMQHPWVSVDHEHVGWVVFFAMMAPLFLFAHRFERAPAGGMENEKRSAVSAEHTSASGHPPRLSRSAVVPVAFVVLAGAALVNSVASIAPVPVDASPSAPVSLPQSIGEWRLGGPWEGATLPMFGGADREVAGIYEIDAGVVHVYAAGYSAQRQGAELIYYANRVGGRDPVLSSPSAARPGDGVPFRRLLAERPDGARRLVWVSYAVAGFATDNDMLAKLYQVIGTLRGRRDAQVVVMSADCSQSCADAERLLARFAEPAARSLLGLVGPSARAAGVPDENGCGATTEC